MKALPLMYWSLKMHKNPVGSRLTSVPPKCTLKFLSKDVTAVFKLFYINIENYFSKCRIWSGVKRF